MSMYLMDMTQPEAEAALRANPTVIIPTGSVEQHGPHLPFGTDYYASLLVGREVAERTRSLLVPFAPHGVTPFHMSFPITLTLRPETYSSLLRDVCESVTRHGARRIVIVNWHEGNSSLINSVAASVQEQHEVEFLVAQAQYIAQELFGQQSGLTHGGYIETLAVMAYDSSLVHLDRAEDVGLPEESVRMDALRRSRTAYPILRDIRQIAPQGWYGNPHDADPARAGEFAEGIADVVIDAMRTVLGPESLGPEDAQ